MSLAALLPRIRQDEGYTALRDRLALDDLSIPVRFSVLDAAKPALLAALHVELHRPTILLVNRLARARQFAEELALWSPGRHQIYLFPETDALPYERLPVGPEHLYDRLRTMVALCHNEPGSEPPLVIVTARAAMDRLMAPDQCRATTTRVRVGERIRPDALLSGWVASGYEPTSLIERPGEFARRGGIIDIYPYGISPRDGAVEAYRIELWGNDIDSIRTLDPLTQRSIAPIEQVVIGPAYEVLPPLPERASEQLDQLNLRSVRSDVADAVEDELRMLREGQSFATIDLYRGVLGTSSILNYLPPDGLLILDEPGAVAATARELHRQAEELCIDLLERGEAPGNLPRPYWTWEELSPKLAGRGARVDLVLDPDALDAAFRPAPSYSGRLPQLVDEVSGRRDGALAIVSQQSARLEELVGRAVSDQETGETAEVNRGPDPHPTQVSGLRTQDSVLLLHGSLNEGWRNESIGLTLLTDRELFGWAKVRRSVRRPGMGARERFLSDLEVGELVVHVDHGIGRYRGLVRLTDRTTGQEREYLDIEYGENGRLRVPVEHVDRVNRYIGSGEAVPSLTRLGSGEWQRTKQRIRNAVQRIARELVELYASRELAEAQPFGEDTQWQFELEASFPFLETPDQLQAIAEVKEDLEKPRPMDRLLVGDVGYGKTEVALRAAFKAVSYGRQVAVLVPTTVLAQQHFTTFRERLAAFPVRVEMLSRFLTDKQAREVIQDVKAGKVDIVIGTHRLLQKDVGFKDLGLVIIDEEQRFGVAHKERFKELRTEVHVLTLSATPIPRTLHLSLVGVRDLSMIQTPPEERLPIRTYVTEFDEGLVREAILRELDRGGQVFYVSNRVYNIEIVASRLSRLVPEARITIAHGQMGDDELEDTMLSFSNGEADVLVCTTIIEAGLDLPNVNTIIVTNADQFGLSQLYQLRGRVGRGANRAYAYFLYGRDRPLTEIAEKRLRAIFEATALGAGYSIALKDLEIRGAGNLLGVEQHGHISAVGLDLYCRLLGEAVDQLKSLRELALSTDRMAERVLSGSLVEEQIASVNLPLSASLPEDYVTDEAARLSLYQRLSSVRKGEQLGDLIGEIEDRFGAIPELAMNLVYLLSLRLAATEAGIEEILVDGGEIVLRFTGPRTVDTVALSRAVGVTVHARANQVRIPMGRGSEWMAHVRTLVDELVLRFTSPHTAAERAAERLGGGS